MSPYLFHSLPSLEPGLVHEHKFAGKRAALSSVVAVLDARCLPDGEYPEGVINSIYFDFPDLRSYREKDNGDHLKTKIRLRWYGEDSALPADVPAYLECKRRIGSTRHKTRFETEVRRELALETPFDAPAWTEFLAARERELGEPVATGWMPVIRIAYRRLRYVDPIDGSRVSVDWDIRADRFHPDLFPWAVPIKLDDIVCEYKKQDDSPPAWSETVQLLGLRFGSFSKFGECMRRTIEGEP